MTNLYKYYYIIRSNFCIYFCVCVCKHIKENLFPVYTWGKIFHYPNSQKTCLKEESRAVVKSQ
jgi:hypothetical protein